jgi:long-chain acyl-CoA synthetase
VNLAAIVDPHPDAAAALRTPAGVVTYGELRERAALARGALVAQGVGVGDRVGLIADNDPAFVVNYLAVLGVGAVAVPLNPASPEAEIEREVDAVRAKVVVREELTGAADAPAVDRDDDDLAVLIFTSGTAGSPKAAMLSHGNLRSNLEQVQLHPGREVTSDDVTLGVLPLFHIFGLNVVLGLMLKVGGAVVLEPRFEPRRALDLIKQHGITMVAGAPPMYSLWAAVDDGDPAAFATVRLVTSGAAHLPEEVAAAFTARYGVPIHQGYGLTEASPVVSSSLVSEPPQPGSIGVPLPGVEVRLIDDEGEDALVGDSGEIWVRGPNVFMGYWEDAAATANVLDEDGWLKTGDVAVADETGHLWLVDRKKDLIIVSGFNVYPVEVEDALLQHPGIQEAAVVGVSSAATGEAVKAFIVTKPGAELTAADVTEFAASCLARYKAPTEVSFVPELPHGAGGKLLRRELRSA